MKKIDNYISNNINIETLKRTLIYTFIFGLIAHGYCYFNANFSHDSLTLLYGDDTQRLISMGRFIRPLYQLIRSNITLPTLSGFFQLLFLAFSSYLLIDLYKINNKYFQIVSCGILTTNYSISLLNATYMHDSDAYVFSLLLVCIGIWLLEKNNMLCFISSALFILSLGIYQAHINVVIIVIISLALLKVLLNDKKKIVIIRQMLFEMIVVIISIIIYYLLFKIITTKLGILSSNYISPDDVLTFSISNIIERINLLIKSFNVWFLYPRNNNMPLIQIINYLLFIIFAIMVVYRTINKKYDFETIITIIIFVVLCIVSTGFIQFISNDSHDLMAFSYFIYYIIMISLLELFISNYDNFIMNSLRYIVIGLLCICIFDNCIYSNKIYLKKDLEAKSTLSIYTRIIDRIEQIDDYDIGTTKVLIIGSLRNSEYDIERNEFDYSGIGLGSSIAAPKKDSNKAYFEKYLNYPINIIELADCNFTNTDNDVISNMPSFPSKDSIAFVNDVLVVKLSQE